MKSRCCGASLFVWLLMAASLLAGCGGGGGGGGGGGAPAVVAFESATITPQGGEYRFDNGIVMTVPAGAVDADTEISLRVVPAAEVAHIVNQGDTSKVVLAAVQAQGAGVSFAKPVTLALPITVALPPGALPVLMLVDIQNGIYTFGPSAGKASPVAARFRAAAYPAAANPGTKYVHYDCKNNQVILVNLDELPDDKRELVVAGIEELRRESDCFENPCRCCDIRVEEETLDMIGERGKNSCFNALVRGHVQFLSCDGSPTESWEIRETSVRRMELDPPQLELKVGTGAMVSVSMWDAFGRDLADSYSIRKVPSSDPDVASQGVIEVDEDRFQVLAHRPGTATLKVTLECDIDQDLPVTVRPIYVLTNLDELVVPEGGQASFGVRLDAPPPEDATVELSVTRDSGDTDISVTGPLALTFTPDNWSGYQTVVLSAAEDDDLANGKAVISLLSESLLVEDRTLAASEADNDRQQIIVGAGNISVPEGGTASFTVRLSAVPEGTVSVQVARVFGDTDISVQSGQVLVFDAGNWDVARTVVLSAAEDDSDTIDGVATIRVSDAGGTLESVDVRASEVDNDTAELIVTPGALCVEHGQTAKLSVIASTPVDLSGVEWSSSDETVATVDGTGMVSAVADGPAEIVAAAGTASGRATIEVREHCVRVDSPSICLHAPIPGATELFPTNESQILPHVDTALAGHGITFASSDESVVTVDETGRVEAVGGGTASLSLFVDNVVTRYRLDDIPVSVAGDLDAYRLAPLDFPSGTELFLTEQREIYSQAQLLQRVEKAMQACGETVTLQDDYKVLAFNNVGDYVGREIGGVDIYVFNSDTCRVSTITPPAGVSWFPVDINDEGLMAMYVSPNIDGTKQIPLVDPDGNVRYRWWGNPVSLNNNGKLLVSFVTRDGLGGYDNCEVWRFLIDINTEYGPDNIEDPLLFHGVGCAVPNYYAVNNYDVVLGVYSWGQYEYSGFGDIEWFYAYPDGVFLSYQSVNYDLPFYSHTPIAFNDTLDILMYRRLFQPPHDAPADVAYSVGYVCPFSLETNVCKWITDPNARREAIAEYEDLETRCDGLDNDCDGFVDVPLVAPLTTKQAGVCAGTVKTCGGKLGWLDDYSRVAGYEFPEVSCDGLDNDCDGLVDEDCP